MFVCGPREMRRPLIQDDRRGSSDMCNGKKIKIFPEQ